MVLVVDHLWASPLSSFSLAFLASSSRSSCWISACWASPPAVPAHQGCLLGARLTASVYDLRRVLVNSHDVVQCMHVKVCVDACIRACVCICTRSRAHECALAQTLVMGWHQIRSYKDQKQQQEPPTCLLIL